MKYNSTINKNQTHFRGISCVKLTKFDILSSYLADTHMNSRFIVYKELGEAED